MKLWPRGGLLSVLFVFDCGETVDYVSQKKAQGVVEKGDQFYKLLIKLMGMILIPFDRAYSS